MLPKDYHFYPFPPNAFWFCHTRTHTCTHARHTYFLWFSVFHIVAGRIQTLWIYALKRRFSWNREGQRKVRESTERERQYTHAKQQHMWNEKNLEVSKYWYLYIKNLNVWSHLSLRFSRTGLERMHLVVLWDLNGTFLNVRKLLAKC